MVSFGGLSLSHSLSLSLLCEAHCLIAFDGVSLPSNDGLLNSWYDNGITIYDDGWMAGWIKILLFSITKIATLSDV